MALRQAHDDLDRIATFATVRVPNRGAAEQGLDGVVDIALFDAEKLQPILVDRDPKTRL
jgi:hypothetical protein